MRMTHFEAKRLQPCVQLVLDPLRARAVRAGVQHWQRAIKARTQKVEGGQREEEKRNREIERRCRPVTTLPETGTDKVPRCQEQSHNSVPGMTTIALKHHAREMPHTHGEPNC